MKRKTGIIIASIALTAGVALSLGAGFTYAKYKTEERVNQITGYKGGLNQMSVFLNANIWEKDDALFYLYNNTTSKWVAPTRTINPTISGTTYNLHVFVIQAPASTSNIVFARVNPNGAQIPVDGENTPWHFTAGDTKTIWNQTDNFTFETSYNYYVIPTDSWTSGTYSHNNGEKNSGCKKNNLALNNSGNLYFTGSDSAVTSTS